MRTKNTADVKPAPLPNRIPVIVAARLANCHVSYIHRLFKERPGSLGESRLEGCRSWTVSRKAAERLRDEIAAHRANRGKRQG